MRARYWQTQNWVGVNLRMDEKRLELIARPERKGRFLTEAYRYNGSDYPTFDKALAGRKDALNQAGIGRVTRQEIHAAEEALQASGGRREFAGAWYATELGVDSSSSAPARDTTTSPTGETAEDDGVVVALNAIGFVFLAIAVLLAIALLPPASGYGSPPAFAYIPALTSVFVGCVQCALLVGFARVIRYLKIIAHKD